MEYHGTNFLEPPPIEIEGGEPEWEVEKILGDRTYRKKKQYLVRWKDYSPAHDSWVDESDLHSAELLSDYQAAQSAHQSARTNPSSQSAKDKNKQTNGRRRSQRHSSTISTLYSDDLNSPSNAPSSLHTPHRHLKLEVPSESPSSSN